MAKISSGCCPFSGANNVATEEAPSTNVYDALYHCYVQAEAGSSVAATTKLHVDAADDDNNDFIAIGSDSMLVYSPSYKSTPFTIPFRRAEVKGFVEITSIAHLVPTLCYLAKGWHTYTGSETYTDYSKYVQDFKATINALAEQKNLFDWLENSGSSVYAAQKSKIKEMFKFALSQVNQFIEEYGSSKDTFTIDNIQDYFGLTNNSNGQATKCYWKGIMAGAFGLIVMNGVSNMVEDHEEALKAIKWDKAEVLMAGQIGAVSSGLVEGTNSTFKTVDMLAQKYGGAPLDPANVFFTPFAEHADWSDLPTVYRDFKEVFNNLKDRVDISQAMFSKIRSNKDDNSTPIPELIQKMYQNIPSIDTEIVLGDDIPTNNQEEYILDFLTRRMAFCMEDYRDTLSDCVTEYLLSAWKTADFKAPEDIAIPGLGLTYPQAEIVA